MRFALGLRYVGKFVRGQARRSLFRRLRRGRGKGERTEEAVYQDLGRVVVAFEWLQNELVQLAGFGKDPEPHGHGPDALSNLLFEDLVDATETSVGAFLDDHRGDGREPEFRERLRALLDQCRLLARERNKIVQSAYVFLEAEGAVAGIVRSDIRKEGEPNEVELDLEWPAEGSLDDVMRKVGEVGSEIRQCRLQLIAWHRPKDDPPRS